MKKQHQFLVLLSALLVFVPACHTVRFNDLAPGARYSVGDTFTSDGVDIVIEPFCLGGSNWTYNGRARVDDRHYSGGSGNDLHLGNTNLLFEFDYPRDEITLKFADCGGNNNITLNSEFLNFGRINELDGQMIGGVSLSVTSFQSGNNWFGELVLTGVIDLFKIGGQELCIDDVEY